MSANVRATTVGLMGIGSIFLYSGLKGKSVSGSIRALLAGDSPATVNQTSGIADTATPTAGVTTSETQTSASGQSGNQTLGQILAAPYGWANGQQWEDLVSLWNRESGWNNLADNPSSHAYGIAQALPSTKYPLAGQPPSQGGTSDARTQIAWGLSYISSRYGNPSAAWAHETSAGWY